MLGGAKVAVVCKHDSWTEFYVLLLFFFVFI